MSGSTGNLDLDVLVRQAESRLVETAAVTGATLPPHAWGGPLAAHLSLDAGCSTFRNTWPPASGFLRTAAADAADAGAGGLAAEPIAHEPHWPWNQQAPPPRPAPQLHSPVAAPTAGLSEDCQSNLATSLKVWVAGQLSAMDDMQRTALARLQGQLDRHRAEFEAGRKQLREDLAEALAAQRQAVEARLSVPLAGAFLGRSGDESGTGTSKPTAHFDSERWEDHVRNTASALQAMQAKTAELTRLAASQGDIDEALRGALAKHATELAAQRSELWDLGRELELCTRALQAHDFQPAAEPSPSIDARHVALEDLVSGIGDSVLGLEVKMSEGLGEASEEQAKACTALRTALAQHERNHEALREDLRRLEQELRAQFEGRHAALQALAATRRSSGLSTHDDHQQAAVAVATAAVSATDALRAQFSALQEDLHRLARELPREAELREGQARDTAARLDDLGKSVDMLRQRRLSAEISRPALSADVISQVELGHANFQDLSSQLGKDRLALEQLTSDQVKVRKELNEYGERVQEHDAVIDELKKTQGDHTQTVELEPSTVQKLVADRASDQRAVQNELQKLSGQFQEEYAAVRKELEEFSNRLRREPRLSSHALHSGSDKISDFSSQLAQESRTLESLAADQSVVRNELGELREAWASRQQLKLQDLESSLHHELCEFKQEQSTDRSKRERFLVEQLAAVEKTFHDELHDVKSQVKPDRDITQQPVRDEIQELGGQLRREHVATFDEVRSRTVPVRDAGPGVDEFNEFGKQLKYECDEVREHGKRVKEDAHHAREEIREFGNQLANQASTWKSMGLEHGARLDLMEVDIGDLKSESRKRIQDDFVQAGSGHAPVASDAESASDGMGPLAEQKLHVGVSRNDWLLQMIETEREERLMLKQSVDAERLARKEAADQDAQIRDRDQAQMKKELVKAIGMQLSRALQDAQAEYKVYAEEAIERVTGQVNHLSSHPHPSAGGDASKTGETETDQAECEFEGVKSQPLGEMEREIASLREVMESKQGEIESGITALKDSLEEANCTVCDLEGRVEAIEKSESGLKGEALEALSTFLKRTLYEEMYSSIVEELGDHVSRIRSDCEKLGHDIHEAEQKIEDLNEQWEEAEGQCESWQERLQGKYKDLESKVDRSAQGEKAEGRRGALTLDADALMQLQMPRKSLAAVPVALPGRRSTVHGMNARASLQSEARSSTCSEARSSTMSVMTRTMSER